MKPISFLSPKRAERGGVLEINKRDMSSINVSFFYTLPYDTGLLVWQYVGLLVYWSGSVGIRASNKQTNKQQTNRPTEQQNNRTTDQQTHRSRVKQTNIQPDQSRKRGHKKTGLYRGDVSINILSIAPNPLPRAPGVLKEIGKLQ